MAAAEALIAIATAVAEVIGKKIISDKPPHQSWCEGEKHPREIGGVFICIFYD